MNFRFPMLSGLAVAALCVGSARADGPWYVSGSVGGYFRDDSSFTTTFFRENKPSVTAPGTNTQSFDTGVIGNLAVGYTVFPQIRVEAEIGYDAYTGSTLNPVAHSKSFPSLNGRTFNQQSGDDFDRFTGTINAFYDILPGVGFTPYVGAGIGASADHQSAGVFVGPGGGTFNQRGGSSTEGLVLFEAGASYPLTETLSVTAAYRYVHYFEDGQDAANIVKMGIRYMF